MRHRNSLLGLALVSATMLLVPTTAAQAQGFAVAGARGNAFGGGFGGVGINNGFGGYGNSFGNGYGGYNGYNNGYGLNSGFNYRPIPQTYNNMGGLMNSIATQTGKSGSYRYPYGPTVYGNGNRRRR